MPPEILFMGALPFSFRRWWISRPAIRHRLARALSIPVVAGIGTDLAPRARSDMEVEGFAAGGAQDAFVQFVVDGRDSLSVFVQQLNDIRFIQKRYSWFPDMLSAGGGV